MCLQQSCWDFWIWEFTYLKFDAKSDEKKVRSTVSFSRWIMNSRLNLFLEPLEVLLFL